MKVIVTGSCGIVGKQIIRDLKKNANIKIIELDIKLGHDLTNEKQVIKIFKKISADSLINCFAINDPVNLYSSACSCCKLMALSAVLYSASLRAG